MKSRAHFRLIGVAALLMALTPAAAGNTDVLLVELEQTDNGTDGLHQTAVKNCRQFLQNYQRNMNDGKTVRLTIRGEPEVTGNVIHATCIYPDGSIEEVDGRPGV